VLNLRENEVCCVAQMSQYSTLLAHSRRLGVKAVISEGMNYILSQHFPNISIPTASMHPDIESDARKYLLSISEERKSSMTPEVFL